jgi:hypothetical protein
MLKSPTRLASKIPELIIDQQGLRRFRTRGPTETAGERWRKRSNFSKLLRPGATGTSGATWKPWLHGFVWKWVHNYQVGYISP